MELNISELDDNIYDQIPENRPIKVVKNKNIIENVPIKSAIKKVVRPHVPEAKPNISYDDILSKMGMFVADGKLHLLDENPQKQQIMKQQQQQPIQPIQNINPISTPQNSYIYNKYFSNEMLNDNTGPRVPKNLNEYKNMLVQDLIQRQITKQIKSTKLIMPSSNINFSPYSSRNMNKLFSFSNR
jgi:hypothetical protein